MIYVYACIDPCRVNHIQMKASVLWKDKERLKYLWSPLQSTHSCSKLSATSSKSGTYGAGLYGACRKGNDSQKAVQYLHTIGSLLLEISQILFHLRIMRVLDK